MYFPNYSDEEHFFLRVNFSKSTLVYKQELLMRAFHREQAKLQSTDIISTDAKIKILKEKAEDLHQMRASYCADLAKTYTEWGITCGVMSFYMIVPVAVLAIFYKIASNYMDNKADFILGVSTVSTVFSAIAFFF